MSEGLGSLCEGDMVRLASDKLRKRKKEGVER